MTTRKKITMTLLFSAFLLTLVLPIYGINATEVQVLDKIPDDKLLERTTEEWRDKYSSTREFVIREGAIREYVNADLPNNGWNQVMVKENIKVHNFDTIIGKVGYGHELVALYAAKERILDTYEVTEPVRKFHDWVLSKYDTPTTTEEIDSRITSIVSETYLHLLPENVASFNNMANHGGVPPELVEKDTEYWIMVAERCDHDSMQKIFNEEMYRSQSVAFNLMSLGILDYFLPNVYATTWEEHAAYLYANPNTCTYGQCWRQDSDFGTGPFNLAVWAPSGHSYGTLHVYASACSSVNGVSTKVAGTVDMGPTWNFEKTGGSCATHEDYYSLPNPQSSYLWTVTSTHMAWT
jgi:hypothetical protein